MHPGTHHVGKVPNQLLERMDIRQKESLLQQSLQEAISNENYEEAAKIRDELADLRNQAELSTVIEP
jgi:protein arginine kinase activator